MNLLNYFTVYCDAPQPWGLYFQDSASRQMEALVELHDNIMFYLVIILFGISWIMLSFIINYLYANSAISNKYLNHGTLIELIWTITPALILILIAFPSFKLLYLMDEVTDPSLTVFVEGHQWYWSYQYPDFTNDDDEELEFDSYLVPESDLEEGQLRILEVDNRILLPELTHLRFLMPLGDVTHSYASPTTGNEFYMVLEGGPDSTNVGTETLQEVGSNSVNSEVTPISEVNVPRKLSNYANTIQNSLDRANENVMVEESLSKARDTLMKYTKLAEENYSSTRNQFVASGRLDKITKWMDLLNSIENRRR